MVFENYNKIFVLLCCKVVIFGNIAGLHHQGVFRVSGSQIEINCFRDAFERGYRFLITSETIIELIKKTKTGEDPLANVTDASDVNSVAGVLKLYFRELREPLFPIFMFDQFVECSCEFLWSVFNKISN